MCGARLTGRVAPRISCPACRAALRVSRRYWTTAGLFGVLLVIVALAAWGLRGFDLLVGAAFGAGPGMWLGWAVATRIRLPRYERDLPTSTGIFRRGPS